MDEEMMAALEADGEMLRQLTGEDHGPYFVADPVSVVAHAIAIRIAKRQHGENYEGYENSHRLAALDYAQAAVETLRASLTDRSAT